jgi:hypothetical protein
VQGLRKYNRASQFGQLNSTAFRALIFHHAAEQAQAIAAELLWPGSVELPPVIERLPAFE